MTEFVKRDDLGLTDFEIVMCDGDYKEALKMLLDKIEKAPAADVVEVVRCGECKHYNDKLEMYSDYVCTIRHYCDGSPIIVGKDDFCSSGKRKDGGQDE